MNSKKIDFIICYDNEECVQKCISCIEMMKKPEGFEIGIIGATDVDDISYAYNTLMLQSDAKYKVYLQENVYIINENFIIDCLKEFEDPNIGMIGVLGEITQNGSQSGVWNVGRLLISNETRQTIVFEKNDEEGSLVDAINGLLMVTQYDLPWNTNDPLRAEYKDIQHSIGMIESGYDIKVPYQKEAWCLYEIGASKYERLDVFTSDYGCRYYLPEKDKEFPLVSVILPVYNGASFVSETIESIIGQSYNNLQILIVDDCSEDASREIIDKYAEKDNRIERIYLSKNRNVCIASNIAFKKAKGKYIACIGHDDIWLSNKIQNQVDFMEVFPEIGACFTLCDIINQQSIICSEQEGSKLYNIFSQNNRTRQEWIDKLYFSSNCLCAPSGLIRKDCMNEKMYQEALIQLQDYALWLDILTKKNIYIIQEKLTFYRLFVGEEKNLSTMNKQKFNALVHETLYIKDRYLWNLPDEKFVYLFGPHMLLNKKLSHNEILCEKAFILKSINNCLCVERFMDMLHNDEIVDILEKEYGFSVSDFYEFNRQGMIFDYSFTDSCG